MGNKYSVCWQSPKVAFDLDMNMAGDRPHMDIDYWLQNLDLPQYSLLFCNYAGVEEILWMSERNLKELGVKNGAHRAMMVSSLVILKKKYEKVNRVKSGVTFSRFRSSGSLITTRETPAYLREKTLSSPSFFSSTRSPNSSSHSSARSSRRSSMENTVTAEASAEELKKALEWELGLDSTDLRSHAWYHGTIPRQRAEELMNEDGDFLIRDCISRPGDYVLTCRWRGQPLHFVINKVVLQPYTVYERIQYQFEDDCFDTVPDLVTFYVGNKRPISVASGAIVSKPVNRSMPLTYYACRYGIECQVQYAAKALDHQDDQTATKDLNSVPPAPHQPPELPKKTGGIPQTEGPTSPQTTVLRSKVDTVKANSVQAHRKGIIRVGSDPMLSPTMERRAWEFRPFSGSMNSDISENINSENVEDRPPPKPSRVPSKRTQQKPVIVKKEISPQYVNNCGGHGHIYSELAESNGKEPENGEESFQSSIKGVGPKHDNKRNGGKLQISYPERRVAVSGESETERKFTLPELDAPSVFDLSTFATVMLPPDNKPLEKTTLLHVRNMILDSGPRILANHLTRTDLDVLSLAGDKDLGLGVTTGLELLTLPQGRRLREDLLERTECLKMFVAVTVLTCSDEAERVELLNKWIQIAMDTKTALGNLYGFSGLMQGLSMPQISRLKATWLALRQKYTDTALMYETKLRPTMKNMQECTNPQAPNTCLPYLLSLVTILKRHLDIAHKTSERLPSINEATGKKGPEAPINLDLPWEHTAADYGLQLLIMHLEQGRAMIQQHPTFKRNSEIVLDSVKLDDLTLDMFRTEFHLKFLWGSKGATVLSNERHVKFEQVLTVMSEHCELASL